MFCRQAAETIREKNGHHGFTLIEVLIAMAIFSIGILAVGAMQISSTNSNAGARIQTEEYTWVVDQIERLTALPYENLLDPNDPLAPNDPDDPNDFHSVSRGPYTISWKVVENSPVDGAKKIAVTADGSHRRARTLTIEFIKAR
jgi:prepilin-type N-terminal cleavage/methylation domain-containing protein